MKKMIKNEKGFTLIELIIVIAILAIIAAVAVPNILGAVDNSRKSTDVANGKIILNAALQVKAKDSNAALTPASIADLSAAAPANSFHEALVQELNGSVPVPKYKGNADVDGVTAFSLVVDGTTGEMEVHAVGGGDDVQVAPSADTVYGQ